MSNKRIRILSALLPSHKDFRPILDRIREKYNLPEAGILDKEYVDLLLSEGEPPWEEIKRELREEIENIDDLWPPVWQRLMKDIQSNPEVINDPNKYIDQLNIEQEEVRTVMKGWFTQSFVPLWKKFDGFLETTTSLLLTYLATGATEDIPYDWIGAVGVGSSMEQPVVFAVAGQLSDPNEISKRFMTEYNRVFGKNRPIITREFSNNIELLRMKFEGVRLKDIADEYIQRHPSEFARDDQSRRYREQKRRLEERLKKLFQRNEKTLLKLIGDDSKI